MIGFEYSFEIIKELKKIYKSKILIDILRP